MAQEVAEMAAAGRFDYLLIESTGPWKACVTCLVTVLVHGVLPIVSHLLTLFAPLLQDMCHKLSLESAQTKAFCQTAPAIMLMREMPGC